MVRYSVAVGGSRILLGYEFRGPACGSVLYDGDLALVTPWQETTTRSRNTSKFYHRTHPSILRKTSRSRVSMTGVGFVSLAAARSSAAWRDMNSLSVIIASVVSARNRVRAANCFRLEQVC